MGKKLYKVVYIDFYYLFKVGYWGNGYIVLS